jgi:hypothetical protein
MSLLKGGEGIQLFQGSTPKASWSHFEAIAEKRTEGDRLAGQKCAEAGFLVLMII